MSVTCRLHVGYIPHPLQTLTLCTRYEPHTKRRLPLALPAHTPRPARRRPSSPQTLRVLDHILLEREELLQELLSDSHLHLSMTCVRMRVAPPQNVSPQLLHWSWGDVAWSRVMVTESQSAPCGGPPPSCDPRASCRASEPSKLPVKARPRREDEDMNEDEAELGSMIACVIRVCV